MLNFKIYPLIVITILIAGRLAGQPYYFRHYQVENGLSNNATICCLQDKRGFLWFGTKDGLNRFDGYSFKIFRNNPDDSGSIGSNFIHNIYEDNNAVLWVATESGLFRFNAVSERFNILKGTENGPIRDVTADRQGNLWFIMGFTLYRYSKEEKLTAYDISTHFEATSICTSSDGSLWVSAPDGFIKKYDARKDAFTSYDMFQHSPLPVSRWIERIYGTSDGALLVGTSNQGAKCFDIHSSTYKDILTYNADKTEIFVRNFVETSGNECWIATESGIYIYNRVSGSISNLQKTYNDPYSISDNAVYSFCKDKEGGIWAGTYFGGINYYPKQHTPFRKYFPRAGENSLSGNVIREIKEDRHGHLWIGTEDAGLNRLDTATGKFIAYLPTGSKTGISYTNIHGLLVNNDELWIGTFEHGLDIMDIGTGKVIRHYSTGTGPHDLKSNFIYCLTRTNTGEILAGTTRGAYLYNQAARNFDPLRGLPANNWYSFLLKDSYGTIWGATYGNGVNFYNTSTGDSGNYRYSTLMRRSISSDRVNSIFEDSNKNLWFATEKGLCSFERETKSFKTYTTQNGLPSDFTLSMLEDRKNNLWLSTSKGIVRFNPQTEKCTVYTRVHGILNDQFNFNSAYKDAAGRMYFGSVKGLISFHPDEFTDNDFVPPVYITGLQVFNKDLNINDKDSPLKQSIINTDKITLGYEQSSISIDFAALSYSAPETSEYAYTMEGLDKSWTYLKRNRKAYFTDLSPGTYIFKVKASTKNARWNDRERRLTIEILPPWWASRWAYSIYILLAVLVIYYCISLYHRRLEEKNRRKYELLEIAKEKEIFNAKIEFFTNVAHEIKTPLTLIKAPLEKVLKKAADMPDLKNNLIIMERNTTRLIDLTNQLLDFRQTEINGFGLSFVKANVTQLLSETFVSFQTLAEQKKLIFQLKMPRLPLYAYIDLDAFNKILNNLFSNAVKYADSKVLIVLLPFSEEDKYFTIEIKNDGFMIPVEMSEKIFEPFFRIKQTEKQTGTGIGLVLSRSLAQLHKGQLILETPDNIMNVFSVKLPIHQETEFDLTINKP